MLPSKFLDDADRRCLDFTPTTTAVQINSPDESYGKEKKNLSSSVFLVVFIHVRRNVYLCHRLE